MILKTIRNHRSIYYIGKSEPTEKKGNGFEILNNL